MKDWSERILDAKNIQGNHFNGMGGQGRVGDFVVPVHLALIQETSRAGDGGREHHLPRLIQYNLAVEEM